MEKTSTLVNTTFSTTKEYLNLKAKSVKIEIYEKVADLSSGALNMAIISVVCLFAFLFINIGVAFWLTEILDSTKLGFLVLGGFYIVVLGVYLLVKNRVGESVKNSVVVSMSKETMRSYKEMVKEKEMIGLELKLAEAAVKQNMEEAKENLNVLVEDLKKLKRDFNKLKSNFVTEDNHEANGTADAGDSTDNKRVGAKIPRIAITSILDFVISKVLFKDVGLIKRILLPIITNALVTSTVFKEDKKTSLIENLKLKFAKFL